MNDMPNPRPDPSGELRASPAELQAIAVRMRGLDRGAVPPVDAAWIERVVVAATVGVAAHPAPVRALPRWRQFAAAAVAFCGLHTGAIAMSTVAVGAAVAVAVAVWPDERYSLETMSLATAVELLQRPDESDAARAAALLATMLHVKVLAQELMNLRGDGDSNPGVRDEAAVQILRLGAQLRSVPAPSSGCQRPASMPISRRDGRPVVAAAEVQAIADEACELLACVQVMASPSELLEDQRAVLLQRLEAYLFP